MNSCSKYNFTNVLSLEIIHIPIIVFQIGSLALRTHKTRGGGTKWHLLHRSGRDRVRHCAQIPAAWIAWERKVGRIWVSPLGLAWPSGPHASVHWGHPPTSGPEAPYQ